jgi:hypothetical protein
MVHIESHEQRTDMTLTEWMAITGASSHYIPPEVERMNAWDEIIKEAKRQQRERLMMEMEDAHIASHKN